MRTLSVSSKKGKLYVRFFLAAALVIAFVSAYVALAAVPAATPFLTNSNASLLPNASIPQSHHEVISL